MKKIIRLSIEEKILIKKSLVEFIKRVSAQNCSEKSREEVAILPEIVKLTAKLYY